MPVAAVVFRAGCRRISSLPRPRLKSDFSAAAATKSSNEFNRKWSKKPSSIIDDRVKMAEKVMQSNPEFAPQIYDYFLVLDFEATCDRGQPLNPQEIIEFPCLKVDSKTWDITSTFHQYVLPQVHPQLTPFCTQLTGIIQDMVDGQPHFGQTLRLFDEWMQKEGLTDPNVKSAFITCGDWDLGSMLPTQAEYFRMKLPSYFKKWINIKNSFSQVVGHYPRGLMLMLESLEIPHTGRHHSGIDDCKNIVSIARQLALQGHIFQTTGEKTDKNRMLYK